MLEHELKINRGKVHGHNYQLEVTVKGNPDPIHGMTIARDVLDQIVKKKILDVFDHRYLNNQLEHTSGEWIVSEWHKILQESELGHQLVGLQLQETAKNRFLSPR